MEYRELNIADYEQFSALLQQLEGVRNREADSRDNIARYLQRNPGHSFCAMDGELMAGCALGGHDGRRGYLQHVMVRPEYRRQGVAKTLVECCLQALQKKGIVKVHLDVLDENEAAKKY